MTPHMIPCIFCGAPAEPPAKRCMLCEAREARAAKLARLQREHRCAWDVSRPRPEGESWQELLALRAACRCPACLFWQSSFPAAPIADAPAP